MDAKTASCALFADLRIEKSRKLYRIVQADLFACAADGLLPRQASERIDREFWQSPFRLFL